MTGEDTKAIRRLHQRRPFFGGACRVCPTDEYPCATVKMTVELDNARDAERIWLANAAADASKIAKLSVDLERLQNENAELRAGVSKWPTRWADPTEDDGK